MNIEEAQAELRDLRTTDNARRIASKIEQHETEARKLQLNAARLGEEVKRLKALDPQRDDISIDESSYHGGGRDNRSGYDKFFGTPQQRND